MPDPSQIPGEFDPDQKQWDQQMEAHQSVQREYIQHTFRWLIEYVSSYFPEDQLAVEDVVTEVHFYHSVIDQGKPLGVLVYRLRKMPDKQAAYVEMSEMIRQELGVPEVMFVDTETSRFEAPAILPEGAPFLEIPAETLTGRIRELREELMKRAKLRSLRESL